VNDLKLSVIFPAYNEENRLGKTLTLVREYLDKQGYNYEVIVVDDGSTDVTAKLVEEFMRSWSRLKLIKQPKNMGKGAAVKTGIMAAKGDFILFSDSDGSTPIEEIERLWPYAKEWPVVIGSRHCPGAKVHIKQVWHRIWLSRGSNLLIRILAVPGIWDTQCGFKLFQHDAAKAIFSHVTVRRWGFDFESLLIARHLGFRIKEVGINWYNDPQSSVRAGKEAIKTLVDLFKIKLRLLRGGYDKIGYLSSGKL